MTLSYLHTTICVYKINKAPFNALDTKGPLSVIWMIKAHCVPLYLIHFEEDASHFLIFWSPYIFKNGERKKIESYDGLWR